MTAEDLRKVLEYNPISGIFVWIKKISKKIVLGSRAGTISDAGYRIISIEGKKYREHRLAYLYMTGHWPERDIDHKDRNRANNKWNNLRNASRSQNGINSMRSNESIYGRGVYLKDGRFVSHCRVDGEYHHIGSFDTAEAAKVAYEEYTKENHNEFKV
jgi:hypothetical protein